MQFLPVSNALVICGGRNDSVCATQLMPVLNDLHICLLDQKVWLQVKYSFDSERIANICNYSMTVVTDNVNYERIIIFGGIQNSIKSEKELETQRATYRKIREEDETAPHVEPSKVASFLTNQTYLITVK